MPSFGRPVAIFPWSLTGNFPAGGNLWNGQPLALQPAGTWFTPNLKPAAEEFNWLFGTVSADIQTLQDYAANTSAQNWGPGWKAVSFASLGNFFNGTWDAGLNNWLFMMNWWDGVSAFQANMYYGKGLDLIGGVPTTWHQGALANITSDATGFWSMACTVDTNATPHANYWAAVCTNGGGAGAVFSIYYGPVAGPWALKKTFTFANPTYYSGLQMLTFGGRIICAAATTNTVQTGIFSSADAGATWQFGAAISSTGAADWLLKHNGRLGNAATITVAIPVGYVGSAPYPYFTSIDGLNWTARNLPAGILVSESPIGLVWAQNASGPCWILAVNGAGGLVRIYQSTDAITWTLINTISTAMTWAGLGSIGSLLVATIDAGGGLDNSCFSVDCGLTWYPGQMTLPTNVAPATPAGYVRGLVIEGSMSFMALNTSWIRHSAYAGLPIGTSL